MTWLRSRPGSGTDRDCDTAAMASAPKPFTPAQERRATPIIKVMSRLNTWTYRATKGRIGGRFMRGAPVCLLTTTGKVSGEPRTVPLIYGREGDTIVLVASKGGMSQHPQWYTNLRANPDVVVEIGAERLELTARTATADEKGEWWPKMVAIYRDYADYQARTDRDIPVVLCEPRTA